MDASNLQFFWQVIFWSVLSLSGLGIGLVIARSVICARRRFWSVTILAFISLCAVSIYVMLGAPHYRDQPLSPRISGVVESLPVLAAIARLEHELRRLPSHKTDERVAGLRLLARLRHGQGDYARALSAWTHLARLAPFDSAAAIEAHIGRARARIMQDDGVISIEALTALKAALALAPDNHEALYHIGFAHKELGDSIAARKVWTHLRTLVPSDAPLYAFLSEQLEALQ